MREHFRRNTSCQSCCRIMNANVLENADVWSIRLYDWTLRWISIKSFKPIGIYFFADVVYQWTVHHWVFPFTLSLHLSQLLCEKVTVLVVLLGPAQTVLILDSLLAPQLILLPDGWCVHHFRRRNALLLDWLFLPEEDRLWVHRLEPAVESIVRLLVIWLSVGLLFILSHSDNCSE